MLLYTHGILIMRNLLIYKYNELKRALLRIARLTKPKNNKMSDATAIVADLVLDIGFGTVSRPIRH